MTFWPSDLERWVEDLQKQSNVARLPVSQQDLRQKTQELKTLADTLGSLKSEYSSTRGGTTQVLDRNYWSLSAHQVQTAA